MILEQEMGVFEKTKIDVGVTCFQTNTLVLHSVTTAKFLVFIAIIGFALRSEWVANVFLISYGLEHNNVHV